MILDFYAFNIVGYIFLSISYSVGYFSQVAESKYGIGQTDLSDLLFAYHATLMMVIYGYQFWAYDLGDNKLTTFGKFIV